MNISCSETGVPACDFAPISNPASSINFDKDFCQEGLFELRIQASGDAARIFYFFFVDETIILVYGFVKKTQKTPRREIEKALRYKADYERRSSK